MTIQAMREAVLRLIDESELPDDIKARVPTFIDMGQREIAMVCSIDKRIDIEPVGGEYLLPSNLYRVKRVLTGTKMATSFTVLPDRHLVVDNWRGKITVFYSAYPELISADTDINTELEIKPEAQTALVYYVAAQLNGMEFDARPFSNFYAMYQGRMQNLLDENRGVAYIIGGANV